MCAAWSSVDLHFRLHAKCATGLSQMAIFREAIILDILASRCRDAIMMAWERFVRH